MERLSTSIVSCDLRAARDRYLELLDLMGYEILSHDELADGVGIRRCIARTMYIEGFSVELIAAAVTWQHNIQLVRSWLDEDQDEQRERARVEEG